MFEQVVFAGGGHRCWWQAGFWELIQPSLALRPRVIVGASAGAATACLLYANTSETALAYYERVLANQKSNVLWGNLFKRGEPLMPQERIYRQALKDLLGGAQYKQLQWSAPEIRIVFSRPPAGWPAGVATVLGMAGYSLEKALFKPLHPKLGKRLGFQREIVRLQDLKGEHELIDALLASSSTPPMTSRQYYRDGVALDAGLVDNIPIDAIDEAGGPVLVMATRQYPQHAPVFSRHGMMYVQPSEKIPVRNWDCTNPAAYRATYDLGRKDAMSFLQIYGK
jgi:predicted acylesterase/phospholipase RssA